ncbi:MAG: M48 family metallopeptidase [Candidatus Margulisbacteria bacterium]|nr:M48 family metallopeptidase [Candidatus Margulisiibacteriota bacterium]
MSKLIEAHRIIKERVLIYAEKVGEYPRKVLIKDVKSRWGSCSSRTRTVNINWRITLAPLEIVDYLIVHELSHLKHPNHSREFWSFVSTILPDYKKSKKWLRKNQEQLLNGSIKIDAAAD